jgi:cyanate permease
MMGVPGIGIGSTSAAIPGLMVRAVPQDETGSATGFYQVVRYLGFSMGSAVTASILASHTQPGQRLPAEGGYTVVFWTGIAICVAAALAWFLPARGQASNWSEQTAGAERLAEQDAELGRPGSSCQSDSDDRLVGTLCRRPGPDKPGDTQAA